MAFHYQIEIRNTRDVLVEILQKDIAAASWRYDTLGGCGDCDIALQRPFDAYGDLDLDYDVQIWRVEDPFGSPGGARLPAQLDMQLGVGFTSSKELRWSGFIREPQPVLDNVEKVILRSSGYVRQAAYLIVPNQTYASQDVGAIARSIVDTYVVPASKVKRTGALNLMQDTGVVVSSTGLRFFTSAAEAIKTLAEIGGNAEWGVRADREFYFLPRSQAVKQSWPVGDRISFYQTSRSTDELVNRLYLQGAGGTIYTANGPAALAGYQKERVVLVSSIATAGDAALWATAYFSKFGTSQPKGILHVGATDAWIENFAGQEMPPLGRLRVVGGPIFQQSGETFTGTIPFTLGGSYGGYVNDQFRVESIQYRPSETGLDIAIDLGEKRSGLVDLFRAIEFKLSEIRQSL